MTDRTDWQRLRDRRMSELGAAEAYEAAWLAYETNSSLVKGGEGRAAVRWRTWEVPGD